jgi:hypothetical protein
MAANANTAKNGPIASAGAGSAGHIEVQIPSSHSSGSMGTLASAQLTGFSVPAKAAVKGPAKPLQTTASASSASEPASSAGKGHSKAAVPGSAVSSGTAAFVIDPARAEIVRRQYELVSKMMSLRGSGAKVTDELKKALPGFVLLTTLTATGGEVPPNGLDVESLAGVDEAHVDGCRMGFGISIQPSSLFPKYFGGGGPRDPPATHGYKHKPLRAVDTLSQAQLGQLQDGMLSYLASSIFSDNESATERAEGESLRTTIT